MVPPYLVEILMKLITQRGKKQEYLDEETGRTFYSVTQVRKVAFDSYAGIPESVLEPARVRGTLLHRRFFFAIASLEGLCPYPAVFPQYEGYCQSMDKWVAKRKPERILLEAIRCNLRMGYAGALDGLFKMVLIKKPRRVLMDLKSGDPTPTDILQTCAYEHMDGCKADELLDVYLDASGGEAKEQWATKGNRATGWNAFISSLNVLKWRDSL